MLGKLVRSLEAVRGSLPGSDEEYNFLYELLQSREFKALVQVHDNINGTLENDQVRNV